MTKKSIIGWLILLVLWQIAAIIVNKDILVPYPLETLKRIGELLIDSKFYISVLATLYRVFKGFIISLLWALILAILADMSSIIKELLKPIQILTKTIPNISYMIMAILWLGAEGSVSAVSFMVLFPVFFNSFLDTLDQRSQDLIDASRIYYEPFFYKIKYQILPVLKISILQTSKTAVSMGFKVGIMAEIVASVMSGIGRQMNFARQNLDMTGIFAWTICVIIISLCFDLLFERYLTYIKRKEC